MVTSPPVWTTSSMTSRKLPRASVSDNVDAADALSLATSIMYRTPFLLEIQERECR